MAEIGSVTIEVTPVIPEDLQEQVEAQVREAVADVLRRVADGLTAKPTSGLAQVGDPVRRYYVEKINGIWGVRDREAPDSWAAWDYGDDSEEDARVGAASLNAGEPRHGYEWSLVGRF